jgi:hypothetical protein
MVKIEGPETIEQQFERYVAEIREVRLFLHPLQVHRQGTARTATSPPR